MIPVLPWRTSAVVMRGAQLFDVKESGEVAFAVLASAVVNQFVNEPRAVVGALSFGGVRLR